MLAEGIGRQHRGFVSDNSAPTTRRPGYGEPISGEAAGSSHGGIDIVPFRRVPVAPRPVWPGILAFCVPRGARL